MRADRLLSILMLLQARGKMTTQALADELEVSRRTILRDVDALSFSGVPVYAEGGHGGGIALDENYRTTLTGLNDTEIRALFIAGNMRFLSDIGLGEATQRMQHKLSAALPAQQQSLVEQMRQRIYIDPAWWWEDDHPLPFWDELQKAIFEDRRVNMVYENYNGEVGERVVEPYSLVAKASHWYLIARREEAFRLYRVTRLRSVQVLEEHYERQEDFDLPTFWHSRVQEFVNTLAEYNFTLQVHPDRLSFVQSLMPGRYQILEDEKGDTWPTLRFQAETIELAQMLVFGLGRQAVVIDPPELSQAVTQQAKAFIQD